MSLNTHDVQVVAMFVTFGFAIAGTIIGFKFQRFTQYEKFYWIDSAACGAGMIGDTLMTTVLVVTLKRNRSGIKQTNNILNKLILYTMTTGLLTTIFNLFALIMALAVPDTFIWIGVEIVTIRLYTNSVLAVLNTRQSLTNAGKLSGPVQIMSTRIGTSTQLTHNLPAIEMGQMKPFDYSRGSGAGIQFAGSESQMTY
ncbi:uncharacterized protein BXZ73DRAFT_103701 [Epithele typhae]|uniref:uncharacterized protein n=1 Tax=Epithele typhae TaxID=378194 RepID=UPI002007CFC4|nr:uncharacterized protein BXZ73DRAFT_103701 [Epithele typhae]KAH9923969.1 hypothetical protein BXZ73DRAFT_103701 [Epithele typhae]